MSDVTQSARPPRWQRTIVAAIFLAIAVAFLFVTWRSSRPTPLPNVAQDKLACASYTPSHDGHALGVEATKQLVESDLKILADRFRCIRTYSVSEGLDTVPQVARSLGLKVMLGFWISSDAQSNDAELAHGIQLANQYSDVVTAIVVGNEVLLRREQTAAQLRELIERVRKATQIPVTYADVWEFWLRNPSLADVTNFVTVHILPYWEDQPIEIDHALDHVKNIYAKVQSAFPGKQILIGETGWPSAGRPRMKAVPSLINEARFIREFVAYAEQHQIQYNIIEAFDQPWKRIQEGTVGGYWGLYDADGHLKFALQGALPARQFSRITLIVALLVAAAFGLLGVTRPTRPSANALSFLALAGYVAGCVGVAQWDYVSHANRNWLEWTATSIWAALGWLSYGLIAMMLARWADGATSAIRPVSLATIFSSLGYGASFDRNSRALGLLRALVLAGLAYVSIALAYDGRGRDFPLALIGLPITAFALLELATPPTNRRTLGSEELLLAWMIVLSTLFVAWHETIHNTRAMMWCGLCGLFVATLFVGQWRAIRPHERTEQEPGAAQLERV